MEDQRPYQFYVDPRKGILFMVLAMVMFALANGFFKGCDGIYSAMQVVFFRNAFALVPCILLLPRHQGLQSFKTPNLLTHGVRGLGGIMSLGCMFQAITMLPLADVIVLSFTSTLFLTALSWPFLREAVGKERWVAIGIGFMGVLIMGHPKGEVFNWGVVFIMISALLDALLMLNSRYLSLTDSSVNIAFYYSLMATIGSGVALPFVWITPSASDFILLIMVGILGGVGQYFITAAYRFASAGTLAPMIYSALLWNGVIGFFIFGEQPTFYLMVGGILIVGAGLYMILLEKSKISHKQIDKSR